MKVCIVGAGAIGGWLGTRLASAGVAVSALARGATLAALRAHGWRLHSAGGLLQAPVAVASDRAAELGAQDLVVIAVKGPALAAVAAACGPLLGAQTVVLPAMNGVPWWFCRGRAGLEQPLQSVDPGGAIERAIPFERVLGCVVHASTHVAEPGVARHTGGNRLVIGEPLGGPSDRVQRVADLLTRGGFDVTPSTDVRHAIWYKLWGNLTMNPVSALTGATMDRILADPLVRAFCSQAMREAQTIGRHIGCAIDEDAETRHDVTARLGPVKTSMLQDLEGGRVLELDAIVGAVHEIAQRLNVPAPQIGTLLGLTRLMAAQRGLYPSSTPAPDPERG